VRLVVRLDSRLDLALRRSVLR